MKKLMEKRWFFPAAVIVCLCVIALGVQISYGAYIRRSYVKAVIATNETEKLFGSNLLYGVKNQPTDATSNDWLSVYPFTVADSEQASITVPIKIYNYLAEDQDRVNQLDVSYIISFQLLGSPTADGEYSVNGSAMAKANTVYYLGANGLTENENEAARQTLPGRLPNCNEYKITMPGQDLGKVSIAVKAKRVSNADDGSTSYGTDLLYLAAKVVPSLASTVQTATVTGEFTETKNGNPSDYAAYNYKIELSGAPTAVVLTWNTSLLEIDPFFEEKFGAKPDEGQVMFNMEPGITMVQFYRTGSMDAVSWEALGVSVSER